MPSSPELTSSELAVLESLHDATESVSQRELARRAGISVGLVNAVLKRLVHTGYVKTSRLNRRSLEYLLTPEGFAQTALRSYRYIVNTVRGFRDIQERLVALVAKLNSEGVAELWLHGDGELADLVALFLDEEGLGPISRGIPTPDARKRGVVAVLNAEPKPLRAKGMRVVDLLHEFSRAQPKTVQKNGRSAKSPGADGGSGKSACRETATRGIERIEEFYGQSRKEDAD